MISSSSPFFPVSAKPPGIRMIDSAFPVSRERADRVARPLGGDRDDGEVDRLRQVGDRPHARDPVDRLLLRVDGVEVPVADPLGDLEVPAG